MNRFFLIALLLSPLLLGVALADDPPDLTQCGSVAGDVCTQDPVADPPGPGRCCKRAHEGPPSSGCVTNCTLLHQICTLNPQPGTVHAGKCQKAAPQRTCTYGGTNTVTRHDGWTCNEVSCEIGSMDGWKCDWVSGGNAVQVPNVPDCTGNPC